MASVFKTPSLLALEIGWRLIPGIVFLLYVGRIVAVLFPRYADGRFWEEYFRLLPRGMITVQLGGSFYLTVAVATALWATISALGRGAVLRRLDGTLHSQLGTTIPLAILRVWALTALIGVWVVVFVALLRACVIAPTVAGEYPSYVLGFAAFVIWTLILFMLWSVVSWVFPLAATLAMRDGLSFGASIRAALRSRQLRSKLMEINLVMGIVKVCLVVLAMVFSACPLPFEAVATQDFMVRWTTCVLLLWVVASDYFHVVRAAAVLALTKAYEID